MKQPDIDLEKELNDIEENVSSSVLIPRTNDTVKVGWMKPYTTQRFGSILVKSDVELKASSEEDIIKQMKTRSKIMSKICACIILNDFFKINFFSGIYWRYLYYWKQYSYDQLLMIVLEGKKKIPASEFALAIGVAAMMKDTILTMTTK